MNQVSSSVLAKPFDHLVPARLHEEPTRARKGTAKPTLAVRRVALLLHALDFPADRVRRHMEAFGEPVPGTNYLLAKPVPQATMQQWVAGTVVMQPYRVAQCIALAEAAIAERLMAARAKYLADDPEFTMLGAAEKIITALEADGELRRLADKFRATLLRLYREGADEGTVPRPRLDAYEAYLSARAKGGTRGKK